MIRASIHVVGRKVTVNVHVVGIVHMVRGFVESRKMKISVYVVRPKFMWSGVLWRVGR